MTCPHAESSLMRLPGRTTDTSARRLRDQFIANEIDSEEFLATNAYRYPRTSAARFENQIQAYATASIVIDNFWDYLQRQPVREMMAKLHETRGSGSFHERLHTFSTYCDAIIGLFQKRFVEHLRAKYTAGERTGAFVSYICFAAVARRRHRGLKGVPFPSMKDLPTLLVRIAGVIPVVFERDIGRAATRDEIHAVLAHPSLLRLFIEIMMNDRKAMHPLLGRLEISQKIDLNNLNGSYDPQYFSIEEKSGTYFLRLSSRIVEQHRRKHEKAAARRLRRGQGLRPALGCPALYTGQFREMYAWTLELLVPWL